MTEKDIEKMLEESGELDMSHLCKDDILAKAKQEIYFGSEEKEPEKKSGFIGFFSSKKRLVPVLAGVALAFTICVGSIGLYNENFQTIYIDVNPSVALKLNRFERVIGVEFLNEDAKVLLANTKLVGTNASDAVDTVIAACTTAGYVQPNSEIYISATSKQEKNADQLLEKLKGNTETKKGATDTYSVNTYRAKKDEKKKVEHSSVSPAKYKLINEIIEINSSYTFDFLKNKSMTELHQILYALGVEFDDLDDFDDFDDDDRGHGDVENSKKPMSDKKPIEDDDDDDKDDDRREENNKKPSDDKKGDSHDDDDDDKDDDDDDRRENNKKRDDD